MEILSNRLKLVPLTENELKGNYVSWLNDAEVCKYNGHGDKLYTEEMAKEYINSLKDDETKRVFAVYLIQNNCHIGNISVQSINLINKNAEIAFIFGEKQYWGQGFATEAAKLMIKFAKEELKLHRLYIGTSILNSPMQKVSEKLGFQKEGILKDAQYKNGKYNDWVMYGMLLE